MMAVLFVSIEITTVLLIFFVIIVALLDIVGMSVLLDSDRPLLDSFRLTADPLNFVRITYLF
jgi:hypothetical protein